MHIQSTEVALNHKVTGNFDAPKLTENHAPKRGISGAALRAAKPKDKNYKIAVGGGLYLEVTTRGSKLWRWKYRIDKENRFAVGSYPKISLKEAREIVDYYAFRTTRATIIWSWDISSILCNWEP